MFPGSTSTASIGCLRDGCDSQRPTRSCAACGAISYCSRQCQRLDWKRHKKVCLACRPLKDQNLTPIHQRTLKQSLQVHVPPIDQEFQRRFPGRPFLLQEARKVVAEMPMTNLQLLSNNTVSDSDLLQRFHEIGPGLEEFLPHAKPGDVFRRKEHLKYWGDAQQQFRNTASVSPLPLQNGKTHIEIGFTDFGTVIDFTAALKPLNHCSNHSPSLLTIPIPSALPKL